MPFHPIYPCSCTKISQRVRLAIDLRVNLSYPKSVIVDSCVLHMSAHRNSSEPAEGETTPIPRRRKHSCAF